MDFKAEVQKRLDYERLSIYDLAKRLRGIVPQRTIYDWLSNEKTRAINSVALGKILEAMEFRLTPAVHGIREKWLPYIKRAKLPARKSRNAGSDQP